MSVIHEELVFPGPPAWMYEAILNSQRFASLSRAAAFGEPTAGATFSRFDGGIVGRHVELVPGRLIIDEWRLNSWPTGASSIARLRLESVPDASIYGEGTKLILEHSGIPERSTEAVQSTWRAYWTGLFGAFC
jgi:activator of HSP90 ATPase